jgi:hypothetical protein
MRIGAGGATVGSAVGHLDVAAVLLVDTVDPVLLHRCPTRRQVVVDPVVQSCAVEGDRRQSEARRAQALLADPLDRPQPQVLVASPLSASEWFNRTTSTAG